MFTNNQETLTGAVSLHLTVSIYMLATTIVRGPWPRDFARGSMIASNRNGSNNSDLYSLILVSPISESVSSSMCSC